MNDRSISLPEALFNPLLAISVMVIAGVTWHPGPSTSVPAGSEIALVASYEQIQRIQTDHGIIDPSAGVHHEDVAPPPPRYTAPSIHMDPGR